MGIDQQTVIPPTPELKKSSEKQETLEKAVNYIEAVKNDTIHLQGDDGQFIEETKSAVYQTAMAAQNADRSSAGYQEVIPKADEAVHSIKVKITNLESTCQEFGINQGGVSDELMEKLKQIHATDNPEQISQLSKEADQIFLMNVNQLKQERDQQKLQRHLLFQSAEENYDEARSGLNRAIQNLQKDISGGRVDYFVQSSRRLFDQLNQTCSVMVMKDSQYQNNLDEYQHYFSQLMDSLVQQPNTDGQIASK